jgi:hypothetical protein
LLWRLLKGKVDTNKSRIMDDYKKKHLPRSCSQSCGHVTCIHQFGASRPVMWWLLSAYYMTGRSYTRTEVCIYNNWSPSVYKQWFNCWMSRASCDRNTVYYKWQRLWQHSNQKHCFFFPTPSHTSEMIYSSLHTSMTCTLNMKPAIMEDLNAERWGSNWKVDLIQFYIYKYEIKSVLESSNTSIMTARKLGIYVYQLSYFFFLFFYFKDIGHRPVSDFKRMCLPI